ncbi:hypothetical protein J2792_004106 [Novosphingobium capsulatum]|uniref:Uncharacterized protein n=1 Tax=Novosphingobium capsulatum TaxID=13688 RepID=A0ABU1MSI3_9SPHN|nr:MULTISPECIES: hypothetical protein [Novosphingobium]MBB3653628.1 hypothetical protein [Novosphingobium sp. BK626]MBB3359446.1 hypothetical protein [Novosphingobium sp. BK256]MBB3375806.1 hypothetical protein [Novosphingobium sp. BK280]MBB3380219.1 hypothetical protein [Novosphingobium sp. BK258]MBB3421913.1 hypothetical protein [Novosphingobium sp. BK267]
MISAPWRACACPLIGNLSPQSLFITLTPVLTISTTLFFARNRQMV